MSFNIDIDNDELLWHYYIHKCDSSYGYPFILTGGNKRLGQLLFNHQFL